MTLSDLFFAVVVRQPLGVQLWTVAVAAIFCACFWPWKGKHGARRDE